MLVDAVHDVLSATSLPRTRTDSPERRTVATEPVSRSEVPLEGSEAKQHRTEYEPVGARKEPEPREDAAARLQERFEEIQTRGYLRELKLEHSVTDGGRIVVKIRDARTDKVIREVPPEDQVEFAERLEENLGVLFDRQV